MAKDDPLLPLPTTPPSSSSSGATATTPSNTESTPSQVPPKKKKKKGKKKKRIQPLIPTNLTANLGENQKKERESDPEVFEKVTKHCPTATTPPSPAHVSATPSASKTTLEESSTASTETTLSSSSSGALVSDSLLSLQKAPPHQSKCIHDEKQDKVEEYKIDVGRTYSQSSGTISYDSVFVADQPKMNTYRAIGSTAKAVDLKVQTCKVVDLNATKNLEKTKAFEEEKYVKLMSGNQCPDYAAPTPEYLFGKREQQLAKEAIIEAIEEYFSAPRDDMDLMIRIQRLGPLPSVDVKIAPSARTNFISSRSSSVGGGGNSLSSSQYSSSSIYSSSSGTSIVDPEDALSNNDY